jgi:hypothetical protein
MDEIDESFAARRDMAPKARSMTAAELAAEMTRPGITDGR